MARTLIVSPRRYETAVFRGGQVECEDVFCEVEGAHLVTPQARPRVSNNLTRKLQRASRRFLHLNVEPIARPEPYTIQSNYDLLFVYAQRHEDLASLDYLRGLRRCAVKVCLVEELWARDLRRWGDKIIRRFDGFDVIAVGFQETAIELSKLTRTHCEWIPGAVDTLRFHPGKQPLPRTIDVFSMGRRSDKTHQALLNLSRQRDWLYLYDTYEPRGVVGGDHAMHRNQLANLIQRSRYFIANKARIGCDTEGQEELGYRSFEGAAAGALLIGDAPKSDAARALFDWPDAHVNLPFDSTDFAVQLLSDLDANPARTAAIRSANITQCLLRHDWAYRWQSLLSAVGLKPREPLQRRLDFLRELADAPHRQEPVRRRCVTP